MLYKGLSAASIRMTLSPQLGMSESITLWHFKCPLLILGFTRAVSSSRLLEIGIHLQIITFLLLKVQKTVAMFTSLVRARD